MHLLRHVSSGTIADILFTAGIIFFLFHSRALTWSSISAHLCCCQILPKNTVHWACLPVLVLISVTVQEYARDVQNYISPAFTDQMDQTICDHIVLLLQICAKYRFTCSTGAKTQTALSAFFSP